MKKTNTKKIKVFLDWFFAVGGALAAVYLFIQHEWFIGTFNLIASAINFSNIIWDYVSPRNSQIYNHD